MRITIINGPNLNLLGSRQPGIYGSQSFEDYLEDLRQSHPEIDLSYFQSNIEGELVDRIQKAGEDSDGIILNAAAYTHTSIAIGDAVAGVRCPVVEVHISNVQSRESFRHDSYIAQHAIGVISGFGLNGYELGMLGVIAHLRKHQPQG